MCFLVIDKLWDLMTCELLFIAVRVLMQPLIELLERECLAKVLMLPIRSAQFFWLFSAIWSVPALRMLLRLHSRPQMVREW